MWSWGFRQSNCLDRMAFRWQESCSIPRDCGKWLYGSSELFICQEAERILQCETVNSCWQWIRSKRHIHLPKHGSYHLVNNSVWSRNHAMSVTLNLSVVGIIWPASKPVHNLYLKPLHSQVRLQSSLTICKSMYNCLSHAIVFTLHITTVQWKCFWIVHFFTGRWQVQIGQSQVGNNSRFGKFWIKNWFMHSVHRAYIKL